MSLPLNAKRFFLMLTREFTLNKINLLIITVSMILVSLTITYFVPGFYAVNHPRLGATTIKVYSVFPIVVLIYCAVVTSYSFMELNTSDRKIDYLMLPATITEKYFSKYIYTTFGFVLLSTLALSINTLFVNILNSGINVEYYMDTYNSFKFGKAIRRINYWEYLHYYLIAHSILFFAAIYFVKMELPKMILTLVGIFTGISLLSILLNALGVVGNFAFARDTYWGRILTPHIPSRMQLSMQSGYEIAWFTKNVSDVITYIVMYILPFFFWILGFMRLKEIEVRDGV